MIRPTARVLVLALLATSVVIAQAARRVVTTADYDRAVKMLAPTLTGLVVGGTVDANWLPDGRFWYVRTTLTGTENVVIDPVKKTREVVATPPAGAPGRGRRGGRTRRARRRRRRTRRRSRRRRDHQDLRAERHRPDRSAAAVDVAGRHARPSSSATGISGCATSPPARSASSRPTA